MEYGKDDMLMLSGIQHFAFCPRQWALIYIECQWAENSLTAEGRILHSKVDDPSRRVLNNNTLTLRRVHAVSKRLGLYGVCDAVELSPLADGEEDGGIPHEKYPGRFLPRPVEYKRGHPKTSDCDRLQLAAQAMCLEEAYSVKIPAAFLFYWETRRRETVEITDELRLKTERCAEKMHELYSLKSTPAAVPSKNCKCCSLSDICMPDAGRSAGAYLRDVLE